MIETATKQEWYQLTPVDAWFFRDSRPSNAGENQADLQSLFPPHHHTVVGAIRAALARQMGWSGYGDWPMEIKDRLGDGFENLGSLRFSGPYLGKTVNEKMELLFPLPRHLVGEIDRDDEAGVFRPMDWIRPSEEKILCDRGRIHLPVFPVNEMKTNRGFSKLTQGTEFFVTASGMSRILAGELPDSEQCVHPASLYCHEPRVGIERHQRTMYSPQYVRLRKNVSLMIGLVGLSSDLEIPRRFPLGGESRVANCEKLFINPDFPASQVGELLVLATPACFARNTGGVSDSWVGAGPSEEANLLEEQLHGKVKTCAVDRPLRIGGFDSRRPGPLPLVPYTPSGSVWWFEDQQTPCDDVIQIGSRRAYGYGLAFTGKQPIGK